MRRNFLREIQLSEKDFLLLSVKCLHFEMSFAFEITLMPNGTVRQGRLVYGTVELQHPQSPLYLIDDIRYKQLVFFSLFFLYL